MLKKVFFLGGLLGFSVLLLAQDPAAPLPATPQAPKKTEDPIDKRVAGILPNYRTANLSDTYTGISTHRKLVIACKDSFDYPLVGIGAIFAAAGQYSNSDPSYGQGMKGFSKRLAAGYGDQMIGNMMTEGFFPMMLHEDPRYFRMGASRGTPGKRLGYALTRIFVTHTDSGSQRFNFSEVLGNATGVAISQSYHFDDRNAPAAAQRLAVQLGTDAMSQVLKEFWPDVKKKFFSGKKKP